MDPGVLTLIHIAVMTGLSVVLLTVLGNLLYLRRTGRARVLLSTPFVSVLVPARNEAARIGPCLEALARQEYPAYEVLVLDDCSEDGTADVARSFASRMPGLRVMSGAPLPAGWVGKSHACAQLADRARGEWLLFTDADVVHGPHSVTRGIAAALSNRADLLTALPGQRLGSFGEVLTVPLLYFAVAGFLPMFLLGRSRSTKMAAASGQYMLFRRRAYDAVGGHCAVCADIVEDVGLSRAVRAAGLRLVIVNGVDFVSCRMYTRWSEVVEGFTKNAFAGLGHSVANLLALIVVASLLFVFPPVGLAVAPFVGLPWAPFAAETALALLARLALALAFRHPLLPVLLHPVAVLVALAIAVRSFWMTSFGEGVRWKGRIIARRPG
jgi:chlorobactene glucosyltransferase